MNNWRENFNSIHNRNLNKVMKSMLLIVNYVYSILDIA